MWISLFGFALLTIVNCRKAPLLFLGGDADKCEGILSAAVVDSRKSPRHREERQSLCSGRDVAIFSWEIDTMLKKAKTSKTHYHKNY